MHPPARPYGEISQYSIPWHTTFIGQKMQHNFWLYNIVDRILTENPQIESIIELGTGLGALTTVFGLWGIEKNIPVLTIDTLNRHSSKIFNKLDIKYLQVDIFSEEAQAAIKKTINNKPTWIFCDGGCKNKELNFYAPSLPAESIISAHDLGVEFNHTLHASLLCPHIIQPYHPEWWMECNIQLAIYKRC
jgi:hypothetical protein